MKKNIISFKDFETIDSKFHAELNPRGGSITFSNSGVRGKKYFNLSIDSFLQCLKDIKDNIISFKPHFNYVEKEWRELGQKYFTDWASLAQIGVQTKPMFSTLSKLIMWANNISLNEIDPETTIRIDENTLNQTINKLNNLADLYTPDFKDNKTMTTETIDWKSKFIKWFIEREEKGGSRSKYFKRTFSSNSEKLKEALDEYEKFYFDDFNLELFKFSKNDILKKISEIKKNISDESSSLFEYSKKTSHHLPRAILGDRNYLEFLNEQKKTLEQIDFKVGHYRKLPKPFLLLAGISGTGKTRFVREQADEDNYEIIPVRPDWHEPSDLLGFVTRLTKKEQYVATDVLKFIVKAWRAILEAGLTFEGSTISGDISDIQKIRPYWLCLDEMNLAPVEQYFADYLSISETQQWKHEDGLLTYSCDSLLSSGLINSVDKDKLRDDLKLSDDDSEQLWQHFIRHGISIPFNLIVAGTVNMDETTHSFSRKVIDRALSFDFGEFYPNDFQKFFETDIENQKLTFPIWTDGRNLDALSQTFDGDGKKSISFLQSINKVLDDTPFKLAYRALNEILLSVITNAPQTQNELCAVWDDFIMYKLLPRIEGDLDKLSSRKENDSLLLDLLEVLEKEFEIIWEGKSRPDLYRKYTEEKEHPVDAPTEDSPSQVIWIPCRSKKKLVWMQDRLIRDTFTSFWP